MFGPASYIIGALALLCVHSSSALTRKQANSVCALLPDDELIANPEDCSQFYSCSNGKATLNSCLGKNLFSKEDQACVPPNQATCGSDDVDPCATMSDGYFVAVPNSCSEYLYCEDGQGLKGSCQSGLNFDQASQACKYKSEYPCTENLPGEANIDVCQVVRSGIYFGYGGSCKAWQKCPSNGPPEINDCSDPYYFNVETQACDWAQNCNCRQVQGGSATGGPSLEGTPCIEDEPVKADTKCTGYYVCTKGKYMRGECPNGKYFDPKTNSCVSRLDAVNNCDRCEGTKLAFVNLYQDDCTGYAHCVDGKTSSKGQCSNGYFSELLGSCVMNGENPGFPVCYISDEEEPTATDSTPAVSVTDPTPGTETTTQSSTKTATQSSTKTTKAKTTTTPIPVETEEPETEESEEKPEEDKESKEEGDETSAED